MKYLMVRFLFLGEEFQEDKILSEEEAEEAIKTMEYKQLIK